ncbi:MAG: glycosyltransferase [Endomicrobiaceae bacterium]|nr:glycosyltransferase [Endomicrobiaceae bacterium]
MTSDKLICAVIVSYEPDESIIRLYESIKNQVDEVIIIDNASSCEKSKKILQGLPEEVKIIYNDKNYGIAKALNQGAKYAIANKYKWLLTLDQDSEFIEGTYQLLLSAYERLPDKNKIMLIAPQYKEKIDHSGFKTNVEKNSFPAVENIIWKNKPFIITSGGLMKTEIFDSIDFFEEKLFIDKVDVDFCFKLRKKGYKCIIATNINFLHKLGNPVYKLFFKIANLSPERRYYSSKNAVYMIRTYFFYAPFNTSLMLLRSSLLFAPLKILFFEKQKLIKIKNIYKGLIDGLLKRY